jgi:hypothetical protein
LVRDDITPAGAEPQSILLNLSRDELLEDTDPRSEARTLAADPDIDHDDLCADVDAEGKFTIPFSEKRSNAKSATIPRPSDIASTAKV